METPAINAIGHKKLYSDGLNIESTLDLRMQLIAREAIRRGVKNVEKVRRLHPSYWGEPPERIPEKTGLIEGGIYDAHILDRSSPELLEVEIPGLPEMDSPITIAINPDKDWRHHFGVLEKGYWLQVKASRNAAGAWKFFAADESHVQACLVALEAETGKVLALIGGYRFFENQPAAKMIFPFQAHVQPGSCFKPIVFACALSRGMTPTDTIDELPLEYQIGDRVWHIENFESTPWNPSLHGETPLRRALIKSMNVASVHLWNRITNDNHLSTVSYFARENMGIQSPIRPERASALGTSELYPIEMAAAYAAFANGGRRVHPYAIERITDHYGNTQARQYPVSEPILQDPRHSSQIAYQITQCLQDVIEEPEGSGYRTIHELYPSGFPFPVAGKTGTTNDCSDAWFTGYNPKIVTCVWVGFERKKSLGVQMTGSRAALPIWAEFMEKAVPLYEEKVEPDPEKRGAMRNFPVPAGMVSVEICKKSGGLANDYCRAAGRTVEAAFITGTEPKRTCEYHGPKDMDAFDEFVDSWIASDGHSTGQAF